MKATIEVRFERLAEEFAPPVSKPAILPPPGYRRMKWDRASTLSDLENNRQFRQEYEQKYPSVRNNYPIRRLQVTVRFDDNRNSAMSERDIMREVLTQLTYALAQELVPLLNVEKRYEMESMSVLYGTTLAVVDPSVMANSITMAETSLPFRDYRV